MALDPLELDSLPRSDLVDRARALGAERPDVMTRVELRDEILRLSEVDPAQRRRSRGFLGVARDLVASVVGAGLNMKDAAAVIRGESPREPDWQGPAPVATLTLAEIYAAQGHWDRALTTLSEVLDREPDHAAAIALRERLTRERDESTSRKRQVTVALSEQTLIPRERPVAVPAVPDFAPEEAATTPDAHVSQDVAPQSLADRAQPVTEAAPERRVDVMPPADFRAPEPAMVVAPLSDPLPSLDTPQPAAAAESDDALAPVPPAPHPEAVPDTPRVGAAPIVIDVHTDADEIALAGAFTVRSHGQVSPHRSGASDCVLFVSDEALEFRFDLPVLPPDAVVRLVGFAPGGDGPRQADAPLLSRQGRLSLPGFGPGVAVRAALGIAANASFEPLAVARVYRSAGPSHVLEFSPPGAVPGELDRAI